MTLLNILPTTGPRIDRITITTTATKTRINAYSNNPWPRSLGKNSIGLPSFLSYLDKATSGIIPILL
jgi:hypothetical protein